MMDMERRQQAAHLAATLKALRKRQRISQPELARLSGVSRTTIANVEGERDPMTGQPPNPQPITLRALARGLATDGDDREHPDLAETFYLSLMDAAGHLPARGAVLRERLTGRILQDDLEALVAEHGDAPPASQHEVAEAALRRTDERRAASRKRRPA